MYGLGGGVGGHSFAHRAVQGRTHRAQAIVQGSLIIPNPTRCHRCPFQQGPGLHWGTHPRAWEHIEALVGCVFLSQNCAAKAAASEADRIWCSSWSHAGCCEPPVRGFFCGARGLHATNLHPGSTPRACSFASQRLLRCIRGCNSTCREFVCGHGGCLLTKTASKQHRHCPKKTKISNILSVQHADPGCSK